MELTREQIEKMEKGDGLNRLIAEKVLGGADSCFFLCPRCGSDRFGTYGINTPEQRRYCRNEENGCQWEGKAEDALPQFSDDITSAWEVVERFNDFDVRLYSHGEGWTFMIFKDATMYEADAETAPLAISRASLLATLEAK